MTCRLVIQAIGLSGGFGCDKVAALNAVRNGGKPNDSITCKTPAGPIDHPVYLADPTPLREYVNPAKLRRVNKYSRIATLAASLALQEAGDNIDLSRTGVIVATGYGASTTTFNFLDDIINFGDTFASPTQFSNSVHSSAASHVTILLNITGPCLTVVQFEMSTIAALANAQVLLNDKKVDAVLLGAVDEINNVLLYCYQSFWPKDIPERIAPLDYNRQTAIPGEGSAFMVLTRDEGQNAPYGYIESVSWQNTAENTIPSDSMIIAGADGHRACGQKYEKLLKNTDPANIKTFSDVYGSLPSGQMFDLALAAIAAKNNILPGNFTSIKIDAKENLSLIKHS